MSKPKSPRSHWQILRGWMARELEPQAGQDGTAEMWASIQALDQHFRGLKPQRATSDADVLMRSCCDRFKNEDHHPDCAVT